MSAESCIEAPQARKATGMRNVGHRQRALEQERAGESDAVRDRELERGNAELRVHGAAQVTRARAQAPSEGLHGARAQSPRFDASHGILDRGRQASLLPCLGRALRPTAKTRA